MDRIKAKLHSPVFQLQIASLLIFLSLVLSILIYKKDMQKWFITVKPLALGDSLTLVFFNRHAGCECILGYYEMAENEMLAWSENIPFEIHLIRIDLDDQPKYGIKYRIDLAPALLLLDADGKERWRQEGISRADQVFDFDQLETFLNKLE